MAKSKTKKTKGKKTTEKQVKKQKVVTSKPKKKKVQKKTTKQGFSKKLGFYFGKNTRSIKRMVFLTLLVGFALWLFWGVPLPTKLASQDFPVSTKLFDRKGKLLFEIYTDTRSTPVVIQDLPEYVIQSTIAIEDKDFYKHHGVSLTGITRAAYNTIAKQKLQGGSTLTQQLVKNSLLTPERTVKRKIREFVLTLIVETIYTKDQILELYLNQIPYGSTAYGIGAASELYFDKDAKDLTLAEAALLAGLPQAPTRYSPFGTDSSRAYGRQETVLRRMVEDGYITQEQADQAKKEELSFAEIGAPKAPHFALWVKEQLAEKYGDAVVEQGGLRVTTTLDLDLQDFAQDTVATEAAELKRFDVGNGAALVTRPETGEILAMVGSKDYFAEDEDGKVNVIFAERQPGSSIKPLNYALGLRDGTITASTPLADVPTCFSVFGQKAYCPRNYDFGYHGAQQVRFALASSYNIPAVRVLALNGIENFFNFARSMGITTWSDPSNYGLSLTLGGGEVRPYDMAGAFGVFANEGVQVPLISILKVEDFRGKVLEEVDINEIEGTRVLEPSVPFIISHILQDNGARSAAFGSFSQLNVSGHPEVSVKTGTTNDLRDNWTVGYTADAVVVVWVGNNDNSQMSSAISGVSGASPIWNRIMREVLDKAEDGFYNEKNNGHPRLNQPDSVLGVTVCSNTGNVPGGPQEDPGCPTRFEYFLEDFVGAQIEAGSKDIEVFRDTGQIANEEALPEQKETQNHPFLLDPLGTLVCLDCPIASSSANLNYP